MPTYRYRAVTENGIVVTNVIEEGSKYLVIKKLKRNNLIPISVDKSLQRAKTKRKARRNTNDLNDLLKDVDTTNLIQNREQHKMSYFDKIYYNITKSERITSRDIIVFTQNFYLLKKANFNNIHALTTIIESTDNYSFKSILEDILAGVEAGENMYTTMEYYEGIFKLFKENIKININTKFSTIFLPINNVSSRNYRCNTCNSTII